MNEKYIIDRIEGKYAILEKENGDMLEIFIENIEGNFNEGDILVKEGQSFKVNEEFTKLRKEKINNIMKDIWK